jgi:hypothetical protein
VGRPLVRNPLGFLDGVLDHLEGHEFAAVEFAVDLLHSAEIDVLDDVAGLRVDLLNLLGRIAEKRPGSNR